MIQSKNSLPSDASPDETLAQIVQELIQEFQEGKTFRFEECVKRYPEYEDRLRQMFPAIEGLIDLGVSHSGGSKSPSIHFDSLQGELGDFRLIREIGRGGMGVVYEAEQVSLARRVALKVLPFAGMLDPRQLQRFQNEARAAAGLHHPNIVPVHSVGCDRGVHYYAMQYIEGRTLAEVISELKHQSDPKANDDASPLSQAAGKLVSEEPLPGSKSQAECESTVLFNPNAVPPSPSHQEPEFLQEAAATKPVACNSTEPPNRSKSNPIRSKAYCRNVAQLGIQIAEALDYAHSLGITHRDIKPSNLLLDDRGTVWVADFGLAQVGTEGNLTLTGEMLGTLRYMSPEQASGQKGLLDQRTDIYSLGITLYELLTLEPAFPSTGRKDLLNQVLNQEPRVPRQLNPDLPRDLETILLKAISKEPGGRYMAARELAADLNRFLDDKPIHAKRPSLMERTAKWSRRHRVAVVTVFSLVMLSLASIAGVSLVWAQWEREARTEAEQNLALATEAVDTFLNVITEDPQLKQDNFHQLRKKLLESALPFHERFVRLKGDDSETQASRGHAYLRLARIQMEIGDDPAATQNFLHGLETFAELVQRFPNVAEYKIKLLETHINLGATLTRVGDRHLAEKIYGQAIHGANLRSDDEGAQLTFQAANTFNIQGMNSLAADRGEYRLAQDATKEAIKTFKRLSDQLPAESWPQEALALSHHVLGQLYFSTGEWDLARQPYQDAIRIRKVLVNRFPEEGLYQSELTMSLLELGQCLLQVGEADTTILTCEEAVRISRSLVDRFPELPGYKHVLAASTFSLGSALGDAGRLDEARREYEGTIGVLQSLADQFPKVVSYRHHLATTHSNLAMHCEELGINHAAQGSYEIAAAMGMRLHEEFPEVLEYQFFLAFNDERLGEFLRQTGRMEAARQCYERSITHSESMTNRCPDVPILQQHLASARAGLGRLLQSEGDSASARRAYEESIRVLRGLADRSPTVVFHRLELSRRERDLANLLCAEGDYQAAQSAFTSAIDNVKHLMDQYPTDHRLKADLAEARTDFAGLLESMGELKLAESMIESSIEILTALIDLFPDLPKQQAALAGAYIVRGTILSPLGEHESAQSSFENAIRIYKTLMRRYPDIPEYQDGLARSSMNLAGVLYHLGQSEAARSALETSCKHSKGLSEQFPQSPAYQELYAVSLTNWGMFLKAWDEDQAAQVAYNDSIRITKRLTAQFPKSVEYRHLLAAAYYNLGNLLMDHKDWQAAYAAFEGSSAVFESLTAEFPQIPEYQSGLAGVQNNLGNVLKELGHKDRARFAYEYSIKLRNDLANGLPGSTIDSVSHAMAWVNLSATYDPRNESVPALDALTKAIDLIEPLLNIESPQTVHQEILSAAYIGRAKILDGLKRHAEAAEAWQRAFDLGRGPERGRLLCMKARSLVLSSQIPEAITIIEERATDPNLAGVEWYALACGLSLASGGVQRESALSEQYGARAIAFLTQSLALGYRELDLMKRDTDLDPIRIRPDFQSIIQQLEQEIQPLPAVAEKRKHGS